jgi:hypothetical protein
VLTPVRWDASMPPGPWPLSNARRRREEGSDVRERCGPDDGVRRRGFRETDEPPDIAAG